MPCGYFTRLYACIPPLSGKQGLRFNLNLDIFAKEGLDTGQGACRRMAFVDESVARLAQCEEFVVIEPDEVVVQFDQIGRFGADSGKRGFMRALMGISPRVVFLGPPFLKLR